MLTKVAALELAQKGVRVNTILPGYTYTPGMRMAREAPDRDKDIVERIPLHRAATNKRPEHLPLRKRYAEPQQHDHRQRHRHRQRTAADPPGHKPKHGRDAEQNVMPAHGSTQHMAFPPPTANVYSSTPRLPARTSSTACANPNADAE